MFNHFLSYYYNFRLIIVAGQETIKHKERNELSQYSQEGMHAIFKWVFEIIILCYFFKTAVTEPPSINSCQTEERSIVDFEVRLY